MTELQNMEEFWSKTAIRFGKKGDYAPVLFPSSKGLLNWYLDYLHKSALEGILKRLSGKVVLDVGCGVGRWSARLAETGAHVVGVDLSREMVKKAKSRMVKRNLRSDFVVASAHDLPFVSHIFDSVLSITVLQHIVDNALFKSAVSNIVRILKTDGEIILLEYAYDASGNFSPHFPTVAHHYIDAFEVCEGLDLAEIKGVDLSLFLKPFNRVIKKHGKYRDQLGRPGSSSRYALSAASFYFLASIACALSLPIDIVFRNAFLQHSEHKIFIFRANNLKHKKEDD